MKLLNDANKRIKEMFNGFGVFVATYIFTNFICLHIYVTYFIQFSISCMSYSKCRLFIL